MSTEPDLEIQAKPAAPFERDIGRVREGLLRHPSVAKALGDARARLLSLVPEPDPRKTEEPQPSARFSALVYDYDEERVLAVTGDLTAADPRATGDLDIATYLAQPLPSADEFTEAAAVGIGDLWALRYRSTELDDGGRHSATDPALTRARLDALMTPAESLVDTDVVLWYAAHFTHDSAHAHGHILGPDLTPENW
ncbi:hypothetical protein AQJ23_24390 [Streptomyces antibioticus]|nr:hypothetical protein [Streptomyces antibioticus]KUN23184.1 hypothetical protein AQJ23_24390 [Streptomyces antibioticus]